MNLTKEKILKIARNYKGKSFSLDHRAEYYHASYYNYLPDLNKTIKAVKIKKLASYKKNVLMLARSYKGKRFSHKYFKEYSHAINHGYKCEIETILLGKKEARFNAIKKRTFDLAHKYMGTCFRNDHPYEYDRAIKGGYLKVIRKILYSKPPIKGAKRNFHTKKKTLKLAKSFKGACFQKQHKSAYFHAFRNGYLQELNKLLQ